MRAIGLIAALLAVLAGGWWYASHTGPLAATQQIETDAVDRGDITQIVSSTGSVRALITVEVGSQLSGQIAELYADFNTPVKAGDLLALIDPKTFERRVQEAEANLAVAQANVAVEAAGILRAQASLDNATLEFDRQRSLVDRGAASQAVLDTAQATFDTAKAELAIALAQHENAQATVQQREASLEADRIDLDRTEIRSPIDGIVVDRSVDIGQTVAASLSSPILFTIAQDLTEIQIEANVDEADIGAVREGAETNFTVDAFPDRVYRGSVAQVRLAPNEEQNVVTYTVVISARNPDLRLLPGMTANVDIIIGAREAVLRVSNAAVRFRPANAPDAGGPGLGGGGPGGGPGGGRAAGEALARSLEEIGVSEQTRATIQAELRENVAPLRGAFQDPNADRQALRERMQRLTQDILARHLTAEQMQAYQALRAARQQTRAATLYVLDGSDEPVARQVRLGISDDSHTEIVSGDVQEGDEIVTRIRQASGV